ncbi:MAG: 50S ribosomal protein L21 [Acidobacteria bacterium]|nr:50S ribosomal protein L21 [Acidobacteriota bacterium]
MYAIIVTGGKQYPVSPGEEVKIEKLTGDVGSVVEFKTLAVSPDEGDLVAGEQAESAKVTGTITAHGRGKKIIVYKFKKRKMYRRKNGHRQDYTQVKIDSISV